MRDNGFASLLFWGLRLEAVKARAAWSPSERGGLKTAVTSPVSYYTAQNIVYPVLTLCRRPELTPQSNVVGASPTSLLRSSKRECRGLPYDTLRENFSISAVADARLRSPEVATLEV